MRKRLPSWFFRWPRDLVFTESCKDQLPSAGRSSLINIYSHLYRHKEIQTKIWWVAEERRNSEGFGCISAAKGEDGRRKKGKHSRLREWCLPFPWRVGSSPRDVAVGFMHLIPQECQWEKTPSAQFSISFSLVLNPPHPFLARCMWASRKRWPFNFISNYATVVDVEVINVVQKNLLFYIKQRIAAQWISLLFFGHFFVSLLSFSVFSVWPILFMSQLKYAPAHWQFCLGKRRIMAEMCVHCAITCCSGNK